MQGAEAPQGLTGFRACGLRPPGGLKSSLGLGPRLSVCAGPGGRGAHGPADASSFGKDADPAFAAAGSGRAARISKTFPVATAEADDTMSWDCHLCAAIRSAESFLSGDKCVSLNDPSPGVRALAPDPTPVLSAIVLCVSCGTFHLGPSSRSEAKPAECPGIKG